MSIDEKLSIITFNIRENASGKFLTVISGESEEKQQGKNQHFRM